MVDRNGAKSNKCRNALTLTEYKGMFTLKQS